VLFYAIFIKPPHFFLESCVPLWAIFDGIIFPPMSNFFGIVLWFCIISLITFVRLMGPYWRWYLWTTMWTNLMLPMIINCITKYNINDMFHVYKTMKLIHQMVNNASIHVWHICKTWVRNAIEVKIWTLKTWKHCLFMIIVYHLSRWIMHFLQRNQHHPPSWHSLSSMKSNTQVVGMNATLIKQGPCCIPMCQMTTSHIRFS